MNERLADVENANLMPRQDLRESVARRSAQLAGAEAWFRTVGENTQDVITVVGVDGLVASQSPAIRAVLGVDADEVMNRPVTELVDAATARRTRTSGSLRDDVFQKLRCLAAPVAGPASARASTRPT